MPVPKQRLLQCVHICPECGQPVILAEMDFKSVTTGIATCKHCGWSGQIEIQVIEVGKPA